MLDGSFMPEADAPWDSPRIAMRDHLVFYVNGGRRAVKGRDAGLTLSDYLRQGLGPVGVNCLTGTKIACAEGDCGACTVLVGHPSPDGSTLDFVPVDACIAFVYQLDRAHVITVEALEHDHLLTPVQSAMVDYYGSQCGFCTPGFVMALHGLVEQRQRQSRDTRLSDAELRLGLSGNLCRCTGYTQILEAGAAIDPASVPRCAARFDTAEILADFASLGDGSVEVNPRPSSESNGEAAHGNSFGAAGSSLEVFIPNTVDELLARRAARPDSVLVSGATDLGVQFNHGKFAPRSVTTTSSIPKLHQLEINGDELLVGAAVSWTRFAEFIRGRVPEYHELLARFGGPQIRHMGTLVGNLANASPIADSIPFHFVAESKIEVASTRGRRQIPIEKFYLGYKQLNLGPDEVILSVRTPLSGRHVRLKLYKISRRRDLDISTVTAAFWIETDSEDVITAARVAVGGVAPTVLRLPRTESLMTGRPCDLTTMSAAGKQARDEVAPISDVRGSANYRLQLVENLFQKFYFDQMQPLSTTG
jgi:xanthine dehydrogenase small subunit